MHVGILTGGGDCPGLNAVIRAVTLSLIHEAGARVTGIRRGFLGLLDGGIQPLGEAEVAGILAEGGTILGTHNHCDPFCLTSEGGIDASQRALDRARALGLDALVAIGGDGTMQIAHRFSEIGLPAVGVPKTIDNDLMHNDRSFGFDSAVAVVAEGLDRLSTTARSHGRVMVLETMGRDAGWIALEGGIAGGADVILLPELPYDVAHVAARCRERERSGAGSSHGAPGCTLVCIAEGARADGDGATLLEGDGAGGRAPGRRRLGGVGARLAHQLQQHVDGEVRSTLLGHLQRGGTPTAFDRVLATRFGHAAAQCVREGRWNVMVALQGADIVTVPLAQVAGGRRQVPLDHPLLRTARGLGVSLGR